MSVKLLTEHHFVFLSLKGGCKAHLSLYLSKCHIVGNHMSNESPYQLYTFMQFFAGQTLSISNIIVNLEHECECCLVKIY